ncbi:hypothetical protein ACIGXM_18145 [Kitasatospora sp. NPDC052896]|uniref:glycan biosynthesis hexose transferase WsfD n=1 Tax=Kitasatospora sp. NPDC052896 TaxID=3364061 RepID=UPI0037CC0459
MTRRPTPNTLFALLAGTVMAALMAVRLFLPSPIGMADNGDGPSRMCALNLSVRPTPGHDWMFSYVNFGYDTAKPGACNSTNTYPGSGSWLPELARPLSHWLGFHAAFDLRALAVLCCLLSGVAFAVFAAALRGPWLARVLVCALLFVVAADSAIAEYDASPFSEVAGVNGLLLATAGAVHLGGSGRARRYGLALFTVGSVLTIASKTQAATMTVPLVALLLACRVPLGRLSARVLPLLAAAVLLATGALTFQYQMQSFKEINRTEMIFDGVLTHTSNPAKAAVELGLPADFAKYTGLNWWGPVAPEKDPRWPEVRGRMTYQNIAGYLVRHPAVTARIALGGADDLAASRPPNLGSYPVAAGRPAGAKESRVALYTWFLRHVGGVGVLVLEFALAALAVRWYRRAGANPRRRAFAAALVAMAAVTAVEFLTAVYGEAIENTKHLVYAILTTGLVFVLAAATAWCSPEPEPTAKNPLARPRKPARV